MIVHYKLKNVLNVGPFVLTPGMNHGIKEDDFNDSVGKYPRLRDLLDSGDVEVVTKDVKAAAKKAEDEGGDDGADKSFARLSKKDALEIVKHTVEIEVLEDLLLTEKRAAVKKAIKDQIKKVQGQLKAAAKKAEDEKPKQGELGGEVE